MVAEFDTVFQTTYFSNGELLESVAFLVIGVMALLAGGIIVLIVRSGERPLRWRDMEPLMLVWLVGWNAFSIWWFVTNLRNGREYTEMLKNDKCQVVEGVVEVLHEQPASGHDSGDMIRVGGKEFEIDYYRGTLGYRQTIAHGGALRNGIYARLNYYNRVVLKVEIRKPDA